MGTLQLLPSILGLQVQAPVSLLQLESKAPPMSQLQSNNYNDLLNSEIGLTIKFNLLIHKHEHL